MQPPSDGASCDKVHSSRHIHSLLALILGRGIESRRARTRSEHAEASDKSCPGDASRLPQLSECGEKVLGHQSAPLQFIGVGLFLFGLVMLFMTCSRDEGPELIADIALSHSAGMIVSGIAIGSGISCCCIGGWMFASSKHMANSQVAALDGFDE